MDRLISYLVKALLATCMFIVLKQMGVSFGVAIIDVLLVFIASDISEIKNGLKRNVKKEDWYSEK